MAAALQHQRNVENHSDAQHIFRATVSSNYIYLIELHPPSKDEVLSFIDGDGPRPKRVAKVVVHAGARDPPVVEEYGVHPPDKPTAHSKLVTTTKTPIPFTSRPADMVQTMALDPILREATSKMYRLLYESYDGFVYHNCTDRCLTFIDSAPRDTSDGRREAWVWLVRVIPHRLVYQVDIDLLVEYTGKWWRVGGVMSRVDRDATKDFQLIYCFI